MSARSIYADPTRCRVRRTRDARDAQQARARARLRALEGDAPALDPERLAPIHAVLRGFREGARTPDGRSPLAAYLDRLAAEVTDLEAWVARRTPEAREDGATIRRALDFLRAFGRVTALDFSCIPDDERPLLVRLLALEHRWCYAAAGTTREVFKEVTGRTGAR